MKSVSKGESGDLLILTDVVVEANNEPETHPAGVLHRFDSNTGRVLLIGTATPEEIATRGQDRCGDLPADTSADDASDA